MSTIRASEQRPASPASRATAPGRISRALPFTNWCRLHWLRKARLCCAQPTFAYSLFFAVVGIAFLLAGPVLDPDLSVVGLILLAVAMLMLVTFSLLAYRAFGAQERPCVSDIGGAAKPIPERS